MDKYIHPTPGKTMSGSGALLLHFLKGFCPFLSVSRSLLPSPSCFRILERERTEFLICVKQTIPVPWELRTPGEAVGFSYAPLPSKDFNYPQLHWTQQPGVS